MTTLYLASKLMSTKLDKDAISDIRSQKCKLTKEIKEYAGSLQKIMKIQSMSKTCRLCLRPGDQRIFNGDENLANDIQFVLQIVVTENDSLPQCICDKCKRKLDTMLKFKQQADTSQWRLTQELEILNKEQSEQDLEPSFEEYEGGYFQDDGDEVVRQWKCHKCLLVLHNLDDIIAHGKLRNCRPPAKKKYICDVCGKKLATPASFRIHKLTHTEGPGQFKCQYCDYRSKQKFSVKLHERSHTGHKPCICQHCGKAFTTASLLYAHRRRHHMPDMPKYHCSYCKKPFKCTGSLKDHIDSVHEKDRKHPCNVCEKIFSTRKWLLRHERKIHKRPKLKGLGIPYQQNM